MAMRTDERAAEAIGRIVARGTVSTAEWSALGLPFEAWLRYVQAGHAMRKTFHGALVAQWKRDKAKAERSE